MSGNEERGRQITRHRVSTENKNYRSKRLQKLSSVSIFTINLMYKRRKGRVRLWYILFVTYCDRLKLTRVP